MLRIITIGEMSEKKDDWESKLPPEEYRNMFMRNCFFTIFAFTALAALLAFGVMWCFTVVIFAFEIFLAVQIFGLAKLVGIKKSKTIVLMLPVNAAVFALFFVLRTVVVGIFKSQGLL